MKIDMLNRVKIYDENYKGYVQANIDPAFEFLDSLGINYKNILMNTNFLTDFFKSNDEKEQIEYGVKTFLEKEESNKIIQRRIAEELLFQNLTNESLITKTVIEQILLDFSSRIRESIKRKDDDYFRYVKSPYKIMVNFYDNKNRIGLYKEIGIDYRKELLSKECKKDLLKEFDEIEIRKIVANKKKELLDKYFGFVEKNIIDLINQELNKYDYNNIHTLKRMLNKILNDISDVFDKLAVFSLKINDRGMIVKYIKNRLYLEENPRDNNLTREYKEALKEVNSLPSLLLEEYTENETDVERRIFAYSLYKEEINLRNNMIVRLYNNMKKEIKENDK